MRARGIEECLFLLLLLLTSLASSPLHQCASKTCTYHYGNRFGIFLCSSSSFSTHTPLLRWSRLKTPIVFPLLLLLLKYYVAMAFLFFSRPKKEAMSLGKNWLFCFSYNLLTQELSKKLLWPIKDIFFANASCFCKDSEDPRKVPWEYHIAVVSIGNDFHI